MEIRPLSSHTGAEVLRIDLTQPVSDSDRAAMNRAFVERSVLVIRDQALTPPQVVEAVGLFGMIFPQQNTKFAIPDCPQIHYVSNQERFPDGRRYIPGDGWHTDHSNAARPPKATVLHAVRLPPAPPAGCIRSCPLQESFSIFLRSSRSSPAGLGGSRRRAASFPVPGCRPPHFPWRSRRPPPTLSHRGRSARRPCCRGSGGRAW